MTNRTSDLSSIKALIDDRHKTTMRLIEAIKTDTACLIHRTEEIVEMEAEDNEPAPSDFDALRKACVGEVMDQIQPLLDKLNDIIRDHRKHRPHPEELDDAKFAERMLEEMKSSVSRRRNLMLARKRFNSN